MMIASSTRVWSNIIRNKIIKTVLHSPCCKFLSITRYLTWPDLGFDLCTLHTLTSPAASTEGSSGGSGGGSAWWPMTCIGRWNYDLTSTAVNHPCILSHCLPCVFIHPYKTHSLTVQSPPFSVTWIPIAPHTTLLLQSKFQQMGLQGFMLLGYKFGCGWGYWDRSLHVRV